MQRKHILTCFTGTSGSHDCMIIPFDLDYNHHITQFDLKLYDINNSDLPSISNISLVHKNNNGKNTILKYGFTKVKDKYIVRFPKKYHYTFDDSKKKNICLCISFRNVVNAKNKIIVKWECFPKIITQKNPILNIQNLINSTINNLTLVTADIYYCPDLFNVCFNIKNQYIVVSISSLSIVENYYDFGLQKNTIMESLKKQTMSGYMRKVTTMNMYYNESSNKFLFYSTLFEPIEINILYDNAYICTIDNSGHKTFSFRTDEPNS